MTSGNSTVAVLLHGWPVTADHWRYVVPALTAAGITPVVVTLPGLGAAPGPDVTDFRKTALAGWARERVAELGVERFAIVGHDWGATVGYLIAAAAPARVSALVVEEEILPGIDVDIPAPGRDHYPAWHGPLNRAPGLAEALVPGREAAYYGLFLEQSAGPAGLDPGTVRSYLAAYTAPGILAAGLAYYRARALDISDLRAFTRRPIPAPVLAIGGLYGMGSAVARGMEVLAANVTGIIGQRSGHYPAEQEPETVTRAITQFIRRHP